MRYLYERAVPEARLESDDCITVQAPQGALYRLTTCPIATGLSTKKGAQSYYWIPLLLVANAHKIYEYRTKELDLVVWCYQSFRFLVG